MIAPRKAYCGGQQDIPHGVERGKPTVSEKPEGSSPSRVMASGWDTTGVEERGMHAEG